MQMVPLASSEDSFYDPFKIIVCAYFNYKDVETSFLQEVMRDVCSEKMLEALAFVS